MSEEQENEPVSPGRSVVREYYESLLIAFIFVNFARIFVFQMFKIPSGSMYDNLLVGDHIVVNKFVYGSPAPEWIQPLFPEDEIERGDVVIFRYPKQPTTDYVKRVVGLPGEIITIRGKRVFINGTPLDETYKFHGDPQTFPNEPALPEPWRSRDNLGPYRVPDRTYFVMGDNRDRSNDSRFWGTVPRDLIKGRAVLVYWSFRGIPAPVGSSATVRARELVTVVTKFFPRTRWDRTFMVIGHRYHYDEPENALD